MSVTRSDQGTKLYISARKASRLVGFLYFSKPPV
jgi:hypothetical protein